VKVRGGSNKNRGRDGHEPLLQECEIRIREDPEIEIEKGERSLAWGCRRGWPCTRRAVAVTLVGGHGRLKTISDDRRRPPRLFQRCPRRPSRVVQVTCERDTCFNSFVQPQLYAGRNVPTCQSQIRPISLCTRICTSRPWHATTPSDRRLPIVYLIETRFICKNNIYIRVAVASLYLLSPQPPTTGCFEHAYSRPVFYRLAALHIPDFPSSRAGISLPIRLQGAFVRRLSP
jgi:hypothetical protein